MKRYRLLETPSTLRLDDLPTVSVCIPARNETSALEDCLIDVVRSDYEKLEIIVLDDCSQDKTSEIIRSFAQDGVRFVRGETPSEGWLGKNNAYEVLAQEARGEYLVFVSVDTCIDPTTISTLIEYMREKKLAMVSVLPEHGDSWRASVLWAPLRYFWQMILPLSLNTPTATSLWVIRRDNLQDLGGFSAFKDNVMLENVLAKHYDAKSEYRFLIASGVIRVRYAKKWSSQLETAIRLWYPSLHKSLFRSLLVMFAHFWLFVLPVVGLVWAIINGSGWELTLCGLVVALEFGLFGAYVHSCRQNPAALIGVLLLPFVALQEIVLIAVSAYQYKRGHVLWKGRNICYPRPIRYKPHL